MSQTGWIPVDNDATGWTPVNKPAGAQASPIPNKADPAQQPDTWKQGDMGPGSYQTRPGGPILNTNKSPLRTGVEATQASLGVKDPTSLGDEFRQIGKGAVNFATDTLQKSGITPQGAALDPAQAAMGVGLIGARGIEGIASGLESGTKDIAGGWAKKDPRAVSAGIGTLLGLKTQMMAGEGVERAMTPAVSDAALALKRYTAINEGQVRLVNGAVKPALNMLEGKVHAEVGAHANAVIDADTADMKVKNNAVGFVDTSKAAQSARELSGNIGGEFKTTIAHYIDRATTGTMDMREAKALTTEVGREAAALERAGRAREAAPLHALYDGLHDATLARAKQLGSDYAKSWNHYIEETRALKDMQGHLMGDIQSEPNHAKVLDKLTDKTRAAEANEIVQKLKQYNIDPSGFKQARETGFDLQNLSKETTNVFIGKIKAIMKYPTTAGTAAAGAAVLGHASGIPGMGFVLPLIVAGKVAGLLDNVRVMDILKHVEKTAPSGAERVSEPGAGPQPLPKPPVSGSSQPAPAVVPEAAPQTPRVGDRRQAPGQAPGGAERRVMERRAVYDMSIDTLEKQLESKDLAPDDRARMARNLADLKEQRAGGATKEDIQGLHDAQDAQESAELAKRLQSTRARRAKK